MSNWKRLRELSSRRLRLKFPRRASDPNLLPPRETVRTIDEDFLPPTAAACERSSPETHVPFTSLPSSRHNRAAIVDLRRYISSDNYKFFLHF